MYIYIHTHIYTYVCIYIYIYVYTHIKSISSAPPGRGMPTATLERPVASTPYMRSLLGWLGLGWLKIT